MRNIFDIVTKLSKEEKRNFKLYLNRTQKLTGNKRVIELFDLVNTKTLHEEQALKDILYPNSSKNNFYQLKNRLLDDLERSLFGLHINQSIKIKLIYQIGVARIYISKLLYKEAFNLLKKIEKQATKQGHYELLMLVYQEICGIAMEYKLVDLGIYLEKQINNLDKYKEFIQIEQILKHIAYKLYQSNYAIKDIRLNETLEEISQKLSLRQDLLQSPKVQFQIHDCIKKILLQEQNFVELEIHLKKSLASFEAAKLYNKDTFPHKIVNLVWIINSQFKNLKFKEAEQYISKLHHALLAYNKLYYEKFIWTYYQCLVSQYFCSNQCEKAIVLLEELAGENRPQGQPFYDVFIQLNLATIYFCSKNLDKAMQHLSKLFTKDIFNKLPKEMQLHLVMVEIILHFENGDMSFLDYKITETPKTFRKLFQNKAHERERQFLKIMRKCVQKLQPFQQTNITKNIQLFIDSSPKFEVGSNEAISYVVWLQAKLNKENYYTTLLNLLIK